MRTNMLKNTLRLNALVTSLFIALLLIFKQPIAELMGGFDAALLSYLAYSLIGFVALVLATSEQNRVNKKLVTLIAYLDEAWVLASILLLVFASSWFSLAGILIIGLVALVVSFFAYYEVKGIKQMEALS